MTRPDAIPAPAVRRLSLYLRQLEAFADSKLRTVSSKQLGQALQVNDAQVRKDLAYFGQFGQPGIGYDVDVLIARLRGILGTDRTWHVLLVGCGNLGRALLTYRGFAGKGFEIVAAFDVDPQKVGQPAAAGSHLVIEPVDAMQARVKELGILLAVLAVPADVAQSVADTLVAAGIRGILNFAPLPLRLPATVAVAPVDLAVHLEQLSFNACAPIQLPSDS